MNNFKEQLLTSNLLHLRQEWEGLEVVLGWETRNKYKILDHQNHPIAFAAEQGKGFGSAIMRQFLGHWRPFSVTLFDQQKKQLLELDFPFRWLFKTMNLKDESGQKLGHLQQRFAIFRKKFDVYDQHGRLIANINSSLFKFWTFEFFSSQRSIGKIQKKWSGAMSEIFSDRDNFVITFTDPNLPYETRALMLATSIMVDIIYFENKKNSNALSFGN